jgi:selenocysteine lyase/cysteine desulfurase
MPAIPPQRHLFDVPDDVAYFNCAYNTPQLLESQRRLVAGVAGKAHPWERTAASFFEDADAVRRLSARLFGGDADGYAVVPAASYGVSTAARAVEPQLQPGDRILVMAEEFPSNVLPWRRTAQESGATLVTVNTPADGNWSAAILDRMDASTAVVAVSTCHWTNGAMIDLRPLSAACRAIDAVLVVDATQTLGAVPFSAADIAPDFLVAAGYKWLLCPYGFSLLYVSERWRTARPLEESWLAREGAEDFTALVRYSDDYMPGSRRFDVGEKCTPTILPGAIAALEQLERWHVANIAATLATTNTRIAACLERLGYGLPDAAIRGEHMFGARLPAGQRGNVIEALKRQRIHVSQRGNALRFAPHLHINDHDVDRLIHALSALAP